MFVTHERLPIFIFLHRLRRSRWLWRRWRRLRPILSAWMMWYMIIARGRCDVSRLIDIDDSAVWVSPTFRAAVPFRWVPLRSVLSSCFPCWLRWDVRYRRLSFIRSLIFRSVIFPSRDWVYFRRQLAARWAFLLVPRNLAGDSFLMLVLGACTANVPVGDVIKRFPRPTREDACCCSENPFDASRRSDLGGKVPELLSLLWHISRFIYFHFH
jgi:hypothetical protein